MKKVALGIFTTVLMSSCAPSVTTKVVIPAKSNAPQLKRIAVLPFETSRDGADDASQDVESMLVKIETNGTPIFEVIERASLQHVIKEQSLGRSGAININTATKVGKLVGAEGIIFGNSWYSTERSNYKDTRTKCVDKRCKESYKYEVDCKAVSVYYHLQPKVVKVKTAQIISSESIVEQRSAKTCNDEDPIIESELISYSKGAAFEQFRKIIGPYTEDVKIDLITDDNSGMKDSVKIKFDAGIEWAKQGRIDRAKDLWISAYASHNKGYALPYLLGMCSEIETDYNNALKFYKLADSRTSAPVELISTALERVNLRMKEQKKVEKHTSSSSKSMKK